MTNTITRVFVLVTIFLVSMIGVQAATLTCQQVSSASMSVPQFSSSEIEVRCSASGGTVSNVQITPNANPASGLTIANSQTIVSKITNQNSSTAKWTVTGESPNTYAVSYIISTDGTEAWSGASTTTVTVPSSAQLTVEYVLPPSIFTPTVETLDFRINNIGGTTANNVKIRLNSTSYTGTKLSYPTTIAAGASASYSWTNLTGFNESGTYTTTVYIGSNMHDSATTAVNAAGGSNISQSTGWNMISLSKDPTNKSAAAVFSDILDNITVVWSYNASNPVEQQKWLLYNPSALDPSSNTLQELDVRFGYWVKMKDDSPLSVSGDDHSATVVPFYTGWNLVGYPADTIIDVNDSIQSFSENVTIVWVYNSSESQEWNKWYSFNPTALDPSTNKLDNFVPGFGYWFKTTADQSWSINW